MEEKEKALCKQGEIKINRIDFLKALTILNMLSDAITKLSNLGKPAQITIKYEPNESKVCIDLEFVDDTFLDNRP
ncbi:MAG: hypothetical protein ACI3XH_05470 [Phascolarctobacterium sp.]